MILRILQILFDNNSENRHESTSRERQHLSNLYSCSITNKTSVNKQIATKPTSKDHPHGDLINRSRKLTGPSHELRNLGM